MKYLEHTYGYTAKFMASGLEKRVISGGIPNQNLSICLAAIEKSTGTKIVKKDTNTIYI